MAHAEVFVALLVAVVLFALAAHRLSRIPHAVALVIGGVVVGLLPFAPDVRPDPDVIFAVFLPPILYPSAFTFAFEDVRSNVRPIAFLALGLVLATIAAIAAVAHFTADIPWSAATVLGAVLAPTDPVAATAVIGSSGAPSRLQTILEGESLVNDGTSLTALRIAIAAVGGSVGAASAVGQFALVAGGGAAMGALLGWLASRLRRRIDELELEAAIDVLLAYGGFLLAERLHVSGVLALVAAGYVMGRTDRIASPTTRMGAESFWGVGRFLAESILFLLVGITFADAVGEREIPAAWHLGAIAAAVVGVTIGVRLVWMFTVPYLAGLMQRGQRRLGALVAARERVVLGFTGLRGALSVAAALSIPGSVDGTPFPARGTVVTVAILAIVVLLVGPALALPVVLRLSGLSGAGTADDRLRRARAKLARAALARMDDIAADEEIADEVLVGVRERFELRLQRYAREGDEHTDAEERSALYRRLTREAIAAQRAELARLRADGEAYGEVLRTLQRDLDVEDVRLA